MKFQKLKALCATFIAIGLLAGCASAPPAPALSSAQLHDALHADGAQPPSGTSVGFVQKTKTKVAAASVFMVASALMGGGGYFDVRSGPRNGAPAGGYSDLDANQTVFDAAATFDDPASAMSSALARQMEGKGVTVGPAGRFAVRTHASVWGLDYDKMGEKDNYRVYYSVTTQFFEGKKLVPADICEGSTKATKSLDAWLAEDKLEVRRAAASIGDLCTDKLLARLGFADGANAGAQAPIAGG